MTSPFYCCCFRQAGGLATSRQHTRAYVVQMSRPHVYDYLTCGLCTGGACPREVLVDVQLIGSPWLRWRMLVEAILTVDGGTPDPSTQGLPGRIVSSLIRSSSGSNCSLRSRCSLASSLCLAFAFSTCALRASTNPRSALTSEPSSWCSLSSGPACQLSIYCAGGYRCRDGALGELVLKSVESYRPGQNPRRSILHGTTTGDLCYGVMQL
jgi:hypothetical protein